MSEPQLKFTITFDFGPLVRAVKLMTEAFGQAALAMVRLGEKLVPSIPPHAFTPNYDLSCAQCGLGPEHCRGGRS